MAWRILGSLSLLALAWLLPAPARASQLIPRTMAELSSQSDVIFVGRCDSVAPHWNADHSLILTASRFRVSRVLKGAPVVTFTVEELGGTVGDTDLHVADVPRFTAGEEVLLCVHRTPLGRWETFGAGQGRFEINRDSRGRVWARNDFYRSELAAMSPGGVREQGAPLATLAGHLLAASPSRGLHR